MDDKQRKRIKDNLDDLVSYTDYDKLANACVSSGLLTQIMERNLLQVDTSESSVTWTEDERKYEKHKNLFRKITKRGPQAHEKLRSILAELQYIKAFDIITDDDDNTKSLNGRQLEQASNVPVETTTSVSNVIHEVDQSNGVNNDINPQLKQFSDNIYPKEKIIVRKSTEIHLHPKLETYPMKTKTNRGIFFMVNIVDFPQKEEKRRGAIEDAQSLLYLFREMGFKLFSYQNLHQDDFFRLLRELLDSNYTRDTECFVMALMTHGSLDYGFEHVMFTDGGVCKILDIEKLFEHHVCKNLINKPKVFLFPFCRGQVPDQGVHINAIQHDSISTYNNTNNNISILSDVFVCYAASKGFKAHRDIETGSWYIQSFVRIMSENAHNTSFEDIVKLIQTDTAKLRTTKGNLQTGNSENKGFNRVLYFNPGIWLEE